MRALGLGSIALLVGCAPPHVNLTPPPNLSPEQRVALFNARRGVGEEVTVTTTCHGSACSTDTHHMLQLADGTEVHYPEDLLTIAPPTSRCALHVEAAMRARSRYLHWSLAGGAALLTGLIIWGNAWGSDTRIGTGTEILIGGLVVGGLIGEVGAYWFKHDNSEETGEAYWTYTEALGQRLEVCVEGMNVVPCEATTPIERGVPTGPIQR